MNSVMNDALLDDGGDEQKHQQQIAAPHHEINNNQNEGDNNNNENNTPLADTAFRVAEKKYKLYKPTRVGKRLIPAPETDFSEVLDFRNLDQNSEENRKLIKKVTTSSGKKEAYLFDGLPGLVFLPNFLSEQEQKYWMDRSLNEFSGNPYPNNETTLILSQRRSKDQRQEEEEKEQKGEGESKTSSNNNNNDDEILNRRGYRNGLRWATLGYSYNWSKKTYHPDEKSPFPPELASLVKNIVHDHFAHAFPPLSSQLAKNYEGQTSIVNYFPVGSQMCAHQDVSEAAMEKPLVSISIGCTSVFLMGTTSREDKPFAMFLRSGDVVVFSGGTREAFHAVPRILDDAPSYLFSSSSNIPAGLRVNINVRQVFDEKHGPESLPDMKHFYCMKTANALKRKEEQEKQQNEAQN